MIVLLLVLDYRLVAEHKWQRKMQCESFCCLHSWALISSSWTLITAWFLSQCESFKCLNVIHSGQFFYTGAKVSLDGKWNEYLMGNDSCCYRICCSNYCHTNARHTWSWKWFPNEYSSHTGKMMIHLILSFLMIIVVKYKPNKY